MSIEFILLVNRQGQTRLARYENFRSISERAAFEAEIVRKCLQRKDADCNFVEHRNYKLVYRRYASLFFIVGLNAASKHQGTAGDDEARGAYSSDENELAVLSLIHLLVEALDQYFENVCELDLMFNVEKVHFIIEEMLANGGIAETNKSNALKPVMQMDKEPRKF